MMRGLLLPLCGLASGSLACSGPPPEGLRHATRHEDLSAAACDALQAEASPAVRFSSTTVQVPGIDEADVVKTDGDRMYLINAWTLYVLQAWPAQATHVVASLPIEGESAQVLARNGILVVLSTVVEQPDGIEEVDAAALSSTGFAKLTVIDATTAAPVVVRELYIQGHLDSARTQGNRVRVVVSREVSGANAELDGSPPVVLERVEGHLIRLQVDAPEPTAISELSQPTMTTVASLDVDRFDAPVETVTLLGTGGGAYLDAEVMVLWQTDYVLTEERIVLPLTHLHWFDATVTRASRVASASVRGYVPSAAEISRSQGVLRVVLNEPVFVPLPAGGGLELTGDRSRLVTFGMGPTGLAELGEIESPRGQLFATRFIADRAYSSVGPDAEHPPQLATIDLSDPAAPAFVAYADAPGVPVQLLPIRNDRLLGIAQAVDATGTAANQALQLFDIADPTAPRLLDQYEYAESVSTDANFSLLPIAIHPAGDRVAIPAQDADAPDGSLDVFSITPDARWARLQRIVPVLPPRPLAECLRLLAYSADPDTIASIEQSPEQLASIRERCDVYNRTYMRRGLFRDEVVYAISSLSVGAYSLAAAAPPLQQVVLPYTPFSR